MAYEKQTWVNGDVITAEKLNHIEEGIENSDNGYECVKSETPLFEEQITTTVQGDYSIENFVYSSQITEDVIAVVIDGTEYVCSNVAPSGVGVYAYGGINPSSGHPDFTEYSFAIMSTAYSNVLYTKNSGTYDIAVYPLEAETTSCFKKAVKAVTPSRYTYFEITGSPQSGYSTSIPQDTIYQKCVMGERLVGVVASAGNVEVNYIGHSLQEECTYFLGIMDGGSSAATFGVTITRFKIPMGGGQITRDTIILNAQ